jgi:4-hydroxy-tetrahydrodipicolinate synthase
MQFTGTGVALVTPFKGAAVDFDGLGRLIDHVIAGGIDYVVSLGTTGETATLTAAEQLAVLDFTIGRVASRCGVVAGFGGNNTAKLCEEIRAFHFEGVSAILSASPAYNKPTQEGIYQHYLAVAEAAPRPIILYNVPARTASNMTAETTLRLAAHGTDAFLGIKEASGNLTQIMTIAKHAPKDFLVISGDDNLTLPMMAVGAKGLISVTANAFPHEVCGMVAAALHGDYTTARKLHFGLQDLTDLLFAEGNPAGVKAALAQLDICSRDVRLPLIPASEKLQAALQSAALQLTVNSYA